MTFDLDAVIAEEQKGTQPPPFVFKFDKKTYKLPGRIDGRALAQSDRGRMHIALQILAGPEQWAEIEAASKVLTQATMTQLLIAWAKHCNGTTLGKPRRSGAPAKPKAKPSKRTSRATTASGSAK